MIILKKKSCSLILMGAFILIMGFNAPSYAEDGFLRKYFPILFGEDGKVGPEDTLVAPFADDAAEKEKENKKAPPKLGNPDKPLDKPHLSYIEIQDWAMDKVSNAMNVEEGTFQTNLKELRPHFTNNALQLYIAYLEELGIASELRNNDKILSTIIMDRPVQTYWDESCKHLISEYLQSGRYHWRFDMNIIYALKDKSASDYSKVTEREGTKAQIRILIRRASSENSADGLVIMDWGPATPC